MEDYKDKKWKSEAHLYRQHLSAAFYDSEWKMKHIQNIAIYENMPDRKIRDRIKYFYQYHDNIQINEKDPESKTKQYPAFIALIEFSTTNRYLKEFQQGKYFGENKLIIPEKFKELEKIVLDEIKQDAMISDIMEKITQEEEKFEKLVAKNKMLLEAIKDKESVIEKIEQARKRYNV